MPLRQMARPELCNGPKRAALGLKIRLDEVKANTHAKIAKGMLQKAYQL